MSGAMRMPRELGLGIALAGVMIVMSVLSPHFLTARNLLEMTRHLAEAGIVACGMTLVIMTGGIDLSVGSLLGMSGIVFGYAWQAWGMAVAVPLCLLAGLAAGAFNGWLIIRFDLPPLVATLGTMALFRGVAMVISRARPVSGFPGSFTWIGQGHLGPVPVQLLFWIAAALATHLLIVRTPVGRYAAAIGANERAAVFAAVPVRAVKFWLYTGLGVLCAVSALIFSARVSTAKADAGLGLELEAITAVVLGGTQITGGRGTIPGTVLGVLILGMVRNGLSLAGVSSVHQAIVSGAILIVAAVANERTAERAARR